MISSLEMSQTTNERKRGRWSDNEDAIFKMLRADNVSMSEIGARLGRTEKQCKDRWYNHLTKTKSYNCPWTKEEDKLLMQQLEIKEKSWARIATLLEVQLKTNRSQHDIKTRCRTLTRKMIKNKWSPEEDAALLKLYEQMDNQPDLMAQEAEKLFRYGRTKPNIQKRLTTLISQKNDANKKTLSAAESSLKSEKETEYLVVSTLISMCR